MKSNTVWWPVCFHGSRVLLPPYLNQITSIKIHCMTSASWNMFLFEDFLWCVINDRNFYSSKSVLSLFLKSPTLKCILNFGRFLFKRIYLNCFFLFFLERNPLGTNTSQYRSLLFLAGIFSRDHTVSPLSSVSPWSSSTRMPQMAGYFCDVFSERNSVGERLCASKGMCVVMRCHASVEEWRWACHHWFPVFTFLKALCVHVCVKNSPGHACGISQDVFVHEI